MRAVIFSGGQVSGVDFLQSVICAEDFVIAADRGYCAAKKIGILPDVTVGDMDSVTEKPDGVRIVRLEPMKDETDTEAAMRLALEEGADEILFLCALGGRADHALANMLLLKQLGDMGIKASVRDEKNEIYYMQESISLHGKKGDTISVIPLETLRGVSNSGLLYALDGRDIPCGTSLGVSNVMTGDVCTVTAKGGCALVIKSRD